MAVARVMELHVVAMKLHVANTRVCWFTDNQNVVQIYSSAHITSGEV